MDEKNAPRAGGKELRRDPRAQIERPVRVRAEEHGDKIEVRKTRNISRTGFFFTTTSAYYHVGMRLYVVLGYKLGDPVTDEWLVEVVRIEKLPGGIWGVAVHILLR